MDNMRIKKSPLEQEQEMIDLVKNKSDAPKIGTKRSYQSIKDMHQKEWGGESLDSIEFKRRKSRLEIDKENFAKA